MADIDEIKQRGGMVALIPADPDLFVVDDEGAELAEDMHLTLAYLGSDVTGWAPETAAALTAALRSILAGMGGIDAHVAGHATFNPTGGPDGDRQPCAVHLIGDSDRLQPLHTDVVRTIEAVLGEDAHPQHAPFLPHITGLYGGTAEQLDYAGPVRFDRAIIRLADQTTEVPLNEATRLAEVARRAFAHGWALTGGPLTERVRAAARVAVGWVLEHGDTADVVEATIRLGQLEGLLAELFDRRQKLITEHVAAVAAAWPSPPPRDQVAARIERMLRRVGLAESDADDKRQRDQQGGEARAAAEDLVHTAVSESTAYSALVDSVAAALRDADAEGEAGAIAIGADQLGATGVRFDLAFDDARDALGDLGTYWGDAKGWIGKITDGKAGDVGRALAAAMRDGATYDEYVDAAIDALDGAATPAIETLIDMAMAQSMSRGALRLYGREGVTQVDYVTAGGDRVCPTCLDYESENPWAAGEAPHPGWHPYCRCVLMPTNPMQALNLASYITSEGSS